MQNEIIEAVLAYIDKNITDNISLDLITEKSGYSAYHLSRVFSETAGISLIAYVTWRKLQFALSDISQGEKIIDIAVKYGFETHGGFAKAFKKCFGFPPSLGILHVKNNQPCETNIKTLQSKFKKGDLLMNPHIIELTPFAVVGYTSRHKKINEKNIIDVPNSWSVYIKPNSKSTANHPTFWHTIELDYGPLLTKLYDVFPKSKHCEICMCYDVDENTEEFSYMLGRGIDNPADLANIEPDMTRLDITGGLFAIFSTPPTADSYVQAACDTWNEIFTNWLPHSEFEYDETRYDFEYHDKRDHGEYFGGKLQIDICIPIRQKEEVKCKMQKIEGSNRKLLFSRMAQISLFLSILKSKSPVGTNRGKKSRENYFLKFLYRLYSTFFIPAE